MGILLSVTAAAAVLTAATASAQPEKPTILLVHGAFADASSWNGVIPILEKDGYRVVAVANPLRSVKNDAQYVADIAKSIGSPVVLVGHSYGGAVISEVKAPNVAALVYVAAFAPDVGETASALSQKFPGSTLGPALAKPVALSGGGNDLYIQREKFHDQFAADVPAADAAVMGAGQRPITEAALNEAAREAIWKSIPSWFIYGDQDRNIPPQALQFMAERAKSKQTEAVRGASHVVMTSHPDAVAKMIERAATAPKAKQRE
ncbi:pimeloyl-ACP methyl ester carboxylesterase [Povalibacter uvarum]|uniref:Pimeloyl-ACP methyl ester carboxylesterase n=1 Tax=Povalibacter uvarum TaxID=732238 RepID=A0A841HLA7_9GAMM|nr:alpha/beta hydrolase [Povalibacter uvarum]MBB6093991.1 pimeloyl-ACP methyl ester carboxylesterase [Povalibacter uvarum]